MDALIRHGQQHQQLVTHRCDECLKEFYRRDKLVEHRVVLLLKKHKKTFKSGMRRKRIEEEI
jgi:hypothetical protein